MNSKHFIQITTFDHKMKYIHIHSIALIEDNSPSAGVTITLKEVDQVGKNISFQAALTYVGITTEIYQMDRQAV